MINYCNACNIITTIPDNNTIWLKVFFGEYLFYRLHMDWCDITTVIQFKLCFKQGFRMAFDW